MCTGYPWSSSAVGCVRRIPLACRARCTDPGRKLFEPGEDAVPGPQARLTPRPAGLESHLVSFDQICVLVTVHADAVSDTVLEIRVFRTEPGILDDLAARSVDGLTRHSRPDRFQCCELCRFDDIEDPFLLVRRCTEDRGPIDIAVESLN